MAWRCSSSITVRSTRDSTPSRGWTASLTPGDLGLQRAARHGEGDGHVPGLVDGDLLDHVEVDDRLVQLGSSTGRRASRTAASVGMGLSSPLLGGHFHRAGRIPA